MISGTSSAVGSASVRFRVTDSAAPAASATRTLTLGVLAGNDQSIVYVADRNGSRVVEFAPGATGRAAPVATIEGAVTGLEDLPSAIAVTPSRRVYVTTVGSILVFAPGASGDADPEAKISGSNTGLNAPSGIAVDAGGRIWVAELASSTVSEFAANANGNVAPIGTIQGGATGLSHPSRLTFDAAGDLWVSNPDNNTVTEYPPGTTGNIAPIATLSSKAFQHIGSLTFDPAGSLHVADTHSNSVDQFAPGATGAIAPLSSITTATLAAGVSSDQAGRLYVALSSEILGYNFGATGAATPAVTLITAGSAGNIVDIAVSPAAPLAVSPSSLPTGGLGVPYSSTLQASGGVPGYHWSLTGGSLPPGVTLSSAGVITGTPTGSGSYTFTVNVSDVAVPTDTASQTFSLSVGVAPGVYAANALANTITEYPLGANGDAAPALSIGGSATGLNRPESVFLDATGRTYVANFGAGTVTEYPPASHGNAAPSTSITGIPSPRALTLDSTGDLFMASSNGSISVYPPGAHGAATPIATIGGQSNPSGLTVGSNGWLYVSEAATNRINEYNALAYAPGAHGAPAPINTIFGPDTGLASPQALVVDSTGRLSVANAGGTVTFYEFGATLDATPSQTVSTGLQAPVGVDRGTDLTLFVGDLDLNAIVEYGPSAFVPGNTISGAATLLVQPVSVAATAPLSVVSTGLPAARQGRRYLVNLRAAEGTTPYRWHKARGHLPPGLRVTRAGAVIGTPGGKNHTYHFTVEVRDATRPTQRASKALTIKVIRRAR